jgi:hypothetical protein
LARKGIIDFTPNHISGSSAAVGFGISPELPVTDAEPVAGGEFEGIIMTAKGDVGIFVSENDEQVARPEGLHPQGLPIYLFGFERTDDTVNLEHAADGNRRMLQSDYRIPA